MTGYLCSVAGKRFFRMNWPTASKQSLIYACRVGFHLFCPVISLYRRVTLYQFHRFLPVCSFPFFLRTMSNYRARFFPHFPRFSIDHPLPPASLRSSVTSPAPWTSSCVIFNAGRASVRAKWTTVLDAGDRTSKQYSDDLLSQPVALPVLRFYRSFVRSFVRMCLSSFWSAHSEIETTRCKLARGELPVTVSSQKRWKVRLLATLWFPLLLYPFPLPLLLLLPPFLSPFFFLSVFLFSRNYFISRLIETQLCYAFQR